MSLKTILKNFLNHVDTLEAQRKLGKDLYEIDFQKLKGLTEQLKRDENYSCSEGLKDVNRRKNRYKDILPYDGSRVVLSDYPGVPGSDFINANYIKGASGSLAYIASQGPLPNTVVDYWRMIWECEVQVIIMACNEQESGKYKCECYWPGDDEKKQYGNITVELVKWRQVCPDFLVRTLKTCWENEERVICQFHYTTWPDHGVPNSVQPILELVRLIRDCQASEAVPVLVHCSAGCGRTGTICAIDYVWGLMRMGKLTKSFNLFSVISDMRRQRIAMVQTKEQYVLVHKAVSSLFEQQLRVIDSHTYENLNEDGEPLILRGLPQDEVLYEDILEPEPLEKVFRMHDNPIGENEGSYKFHEYAVRNTIAMENMCTHRQEKLDKSCNNSNLNSSTACPMEQVIDLSMILPQDYQATAIAQEILNDSDCKDISPSSRNSTILLKLRREESVKRLISGWNKATQQDAAAVTLPTKSESKECHKHKLDFDETMFLNNAVIEQLKEQNSHKNVSSDLKSNEKVAINSNTHKTKRTVDNETNHSGKLVGKATVIRRPSIAKLKAMFEKTTSSERQTEESSHNRRPLFRSHSHYVGHSRTFTVSDSDDVRMNQSATDDGVQDSLQHLTLSNHVDGISCSNQFTDGNHGNSLSFRSPSPNRPLLNHHCNNFSKGEQDVYLCQNADLQRSKLDNKAKRNHHNQDETNAKQLDDYAYYEMSMSKQNEELSSKENTSNKEEGSQKIVPVHQRIKQYSSAMGTEKPPVLPTKRRGHSKGCCKSAERRESKSNENDHIHSCHASAVGLENEDYTLVPSRSEHYFVTSNIAAPNEIEIRLCGLEENSQSDTKSKLLYSDYAEIASTCTSSSSKSSEISHSTEELEKNMATKTLSRGYHKEDSGLTSSKHCVHDTEHEHCAKLDSGGKNIDGSMSKYMNVNSISQKNIQQIEEKLRHHPRGAIIDLTSRKSYVDDVQNLNDRPPMFLSTNQRVKLSQPMESHELKAPEKVKEHSSNCTMSNKECAGDNSTSQSSTKHTKCHRAAHCDTNSKNLLLHSPPPKSKRNHTSKNNHHTNHRDKSCEPHGNSEKQNVTSSESKSSSKSHGAKHETSDRTVTKSLSNSHEPVSRSDPRYFPITRQTPEDAKYACEKQKAVVPRKLDPHKFEGGFYSTSFVQKDAKTSYQHPPLKKVANEPLEGNPKKPLSKAYTTQPYKQYDPNASWPTKDIEPIYGAKSSMVDHYTLYPKQEVCMSSKELSAKSQIYGSSTNAHMQHSRNASAPAAYGTVARESLYGTTKHNATASQNVYPPGPPKPPRTFNHKFKHIESANQEKPKHSNAEGGRYIVSVASPKQVPAIPLEPHKVDYQFYSSIPKRPSPEKGQYPNEQHMSRSYPFSNCDSSSAKVPDANTHSKFHPVPSADQIYHTVREKPNQKCDPAHSNAKPSSKYPDYENTLDAQREYLDAMSGSGHEAAAYNYYQSQGASCPSGIQYSQSDASIYAVIQKKNPVKPSSSSTWQHPSYDPGVNKVLQSDTNAVPKRVYFDTLQRRHKQHVSWEQRRSHDDMDIRPAPSARLKEQIHARRSMVELDNLEISIGGEDGFHEYNPLAASLLPRKDFAQEHIYASIKKAPAELSESLISKDIPARKSQTHSKEPGSFGGTLYKAFGKLTSLTKFNAKDTPNKNTADSSGVKAPVSKEEKSETTNEPEWTPRKPNEHSGVSEQWTEV